MFGHDLNVGRGEEVGGDNGEDPHDQDQGDKRAAPQQELLDVGPGHPGRSFDRCCSCFAHAVSTCACGSSVPAARLLVFTILADAMPNGGGCHQRFLGRRLPQKLAGDLALGHDQDAVGHRHHFLQFGGDEQHAKALLRQPFHDGENFGLGGHVDAAAWLVKQQDLGRCQQAFGDHHLLLIAAAQRCDDLLRICYLDRQALDHLRDGALLLVRRQKEAVEIVVQAGQQHVVGDRDRLHQPFALAVFGHQHDARADAVSNATCPQLLATQKDPPTRLRAHAGQALNKFRAARAHQAVEPDDLAFAQRQ